MNVPPSIADRPKPHILVVGDVDKDIRKHLASLGSGVRFVDSTEDLRQADFAFIISQHATEAPHPIAGNATVLHFADEDGEHDIQRVADVDLDVLIEFDEVVDTYHNFRIGRLAGDRAVEFETRDGPYEGVDFPSIVSSTIAPHVEPGSDYGVLAATTYTEGIAEPDIHPLFQERDGKALAAIIEFHTGVAPLWSLPPETANPLRWVKLFLEVQKQLRPDDFPANQVGLSEEWLTPDEREAQQLLDAHNAETKQLLAQRQQEATELRERLAQATDAADAGDRLLLSAKDDVLVDKVAEALRLFGFQVEDRDIHAAATRSSRKEDLRVTHPDQQDADWMCLAEVKGFTRGAQSNVIQQIQKVAGIFEGQNGRPPSALWYVVNHYRNDGPQARPEPLASNPDEVAMFARSNGLVLDTRELFRLKQRVEAGDLAPSDAARMLMDQRGLFKATADGQLSA